MLRGGYYEEKRINPIFMNKKITLFLVSIFAFGFLSIQSAPSVQALTSAEIQALIQQLQTQIASLQQQLTQTEETAEVWCHDFNTNLRYGDSGSEVLALQTALGKDGFPVMDIDENAQGNYFFGEYTSSAVVGFQGKYKSEVLTPYGLKNGTGFVGKSTRAKLNALYGCGAEIPQAIPTAPSISTAPSTATPVNLISDYFKNDLTAQKIIKGEIKNYDVRELSFPAVLKETYDIDNFAYKITSAIRMLGYNTRNLDISNQANIYFSVLQLNKFQRKHNIPASNFIDSGTLSIMDRELSAIEAKYSAGRSFPIYNDFVNLPATEVPKDHYLTNVALALRALPESLVKWNKENFTNYQSFVVYDYDKKIYCDAEYYPTYQSQGVIGRKCETVAPNGLAATQKVGSATSDYLTTATYLHEYAHYLDSVIYGNSQPGLSIAIVNTADFRKISWDGKKQLRDSNNQKGFDLFEFISSYSIATPNEDFAESFYFYVLNGRLFREASNRNQYLQQKYVWLRDKVFNGIEYDTGGFKAMDVQASQHYFPDAFDITTDQNYIWDRNFSIVAPAPAISACQHLYDGVSSALGTTCGNAKYNSVFDVNKDKFITGLDYSLVLSKLNAKDEVWCSSMKVSTQNPCAATPVVACTDSDGGKNYNVKGCAATSDSPNSQYCDACSSETATGVQTLYENYCEGGAVKYETYKGCAYGCSLGACLPAPITMPSIAVLYPKTGDTITAGNKVNVQWTAEDIDYSNAEGFQLYYLYQGSTVWNFIGATTLSALNSYTWTAPDTTGKVNIWIGAVKAGKFVYQKSVDGINIVPATTVAPSITVLSPNGGETYTIGTGYLYIKYKASNISIGQEVTAYLKYPTGNVARTASKTVENDGVNTLPMNMEVASSPELGQYKIEVCTTGKGAPIDVCDTSDNYFSIVAAAATPSITVLSPNGGETWAAGSVQKITWQSSNIPSGQPVNIISLKDASGREYHLLYDTVNDGSEMITVPSLAPGLYKAYIETTVAKQGISDDSDNYFSIAAAVVTQPASCTYLYNGVINAYGTTCGDAKYDQIFDLNKDKYITGLDYSKIISSMDNEAWCNTAKASTVNPCAAAVTCEVSVTCATGYSPVSTGISDSQGCPVYACQVVPTSDTPYTPGVEESLPTSMNSVENQLADISKAVLRLVEEIAKMAGR